MTHSTAKIKINSKRAECSMCGEVFKTPAMFDKHLSFDDEGKRCCVFPEKVGLVLREVKDGLIWAYPQSENRYWEK